jgi:hypothetical protein
VPTRKSSRRLPLKTLKRRPAPSPASDDERTVIEVDADEDTVLEYAPTATAVKSARLIAKVIATEILSKVRANAAANMRFELETPEVRGVSVRLRRDAKGVELVFGGDDQPALDFLEKVRELLRKALETRGLDVVRMV